MEADLFYAVLFTGIPCWNKTKSFGFTLLYLAVVLSVIWLLTRKDPDRPLFGVNYFFRSATIIFPYQRQLLLRRRGAPTFSCFDFS